MNKAGSRVAAKGQMAKRPTATGTSAQRIILCCFDSATARSRRWQRRFGKGNHRLPLPWQAWLPVFSPAKKRKTTGRALPVVSEV